MPPPAALPGASAVAVLDREFLTIRAKILEIAAGLDRIERAQGDPAADPRWSQLRQAIEILTQGSSDRAERVQMHFSLPYDENWRTSKAK
jgi:hypothetical protein